MDSNVLTSLKEQYEKERDRLHPRAKQIFPFLTNFFDQHPSNITFSTFEKAASKILSSKESRQMFDYLTNVSKHLVLMDGCSQRKFRRNQHIPFTMVAINNMIKDYCFSDSFTILSDIKQPQAPSVPKTIIRTKIISLSDYSYGDLKAEIARRDRENERKYKIEQLQEKLREQKTKINRAAAYVGLTAKDLRQLFLDIDSTESELKKFNK